MSLHGGSCKKTISNDLHCDSRSTTRSLGDLAILKDKTLIFRNVVLDIRKDWVRLKPSTILTITYLLVESVDLAAVEPRVPERTVRRLGVVAFLPAVDTTYTMGADFDLLRSGGDRLWELLGLALATARVVAMLVPSMRLAADGAPATGPAHEVRVSPFATVLAKGDAGLTRSGPDKALPAEDIDGLVIQGLRAGPCLGVPDVEVDGHQLWRPSTRS